MFGSKQKPFYYNIAGYSMNLWELKHGLLRNNRKSPFSYMRSLNQNDERAQLLDNFFDNKILFVCIDYPECVEQIDSFEGTDNEKLDEELDNFVTSVLEFKINIDLDNHMIQIPKVF